MLVVRRTSWPPVSPARFSSPSMLVFADVSAAPRTPARAPSRRPPTRSGNPESSTRMRLRRSIRPRGWRRSSSMKSPRASSVRHRTRRGGPAARSARRASGSPGPMRPPTPASARAISRRPRGPDHAPSSDQGGPARAASQPDRPGRKASVTTELIERFADGTLDAWPNRILVKGNQDAAARRSARIGREGRWRQFGRGFAVGRGGSGHNDLEPLRRPDPGR